MKELLSMKMDKKEKIQYFNHIFTSLLSNFGSTTKPAEETLVEYYTLALYSPIAMFVKREFKFMLIENYEEANKVEAKLDSIEKHTSESEVKPATSKKTLVVNQTQGRAFE